MNSSFVYVFVEMFSLNCGKFNYLKRFENRNRNKKIREKYKIAKNLLKGRPTATDVFIKGREISFIYPYRDIGKL